jgi:hypothetical protein
VTCASSCSLTTWVLTAISPPTLAPAALKICPRTSHPPVAVTVFQVTRKRPSASVVVSQNPCELNASVLTRNSPPALAPAASNSCALIARPLPSCSGSEVSQAITKPPLPSAVTAGFHWMLTVCVLTRNSPPSLLPAASNSCALTESLLPSCAGSQVAQVTTKPPPARPVTAGVTWLSAVAVLTRNSVPMGVPSAASRRPLTSWPSEVSHTATRVPLASRASPGFCWMPDSALLTVSSRPTF